MAGRRYLAASDVTSSRWATKNASGITIKPLFGSRARVAAALPSSVMKSRRLNGIRFPTSQGEWQDIELARISQGVCEHRAATPVDFAYRTLRNIPQGHSGLM